MIIDIAKQDFHVTYTDDMRAVVEELGADRPRFFTYDTEGTGLHIRKDRPFLAAVCWNNKVFVFEANKRNLLWLLPLSRLVKRVYAHNTTFDMHMTANMVEEDEFPIAITNWGDTMGLARLSFEALSKRDGGPSLALKEIGAKYIDAHSNRFEAAVKKWLADKVAADKRLLTTIIRTFGWTKKRFEDAMNKGTEVIPPGLMDAFEQWREECPAPTYQDVPREIMLPYLAVDVILTKLLVDKALPVVIHHEQINIFSQECDLIPAVYDMERQGIEVDREYLIDAGNRMDQYIEEVHSEMIGLAGVEFNVGQHAKIKEIYAERLGYVPASTDKAFLKKQMADKDQLAALISKLRRLEKWKATYIEKILEDSAYNGRFYTSMNAYNTVTGRFSGDAQQFPKDRILTLEGEAYEKEHGIKSAPPEMVLYSPRRAFKMRGYYLDFSQVELRVQAHYTLKFGGDVNLCRAYMPFGCTHAVTGETYDYATIEGRNRWSELRDGAPEGHWEDQLKAGWSIWVLPDTGKPWIPTDVHSSTTLRALNIMGFDVPNMAKADIAWWRNKGKTFNFMRNYGGGDAKAAETLDITLDQAKAMNQGYTDAFPVVVTYQKAVERAMRSKGYVENMSGRRYRINDSRRYYRCANYLIQGTCADDLKKKMIQIWKWLRENKLKTRMVLCVHDELQFAVPEGEDWCIPIIKEMMEYAPEIQVPIVAEAEFTDTTWDKKRKVAI